LPDYRRCWRIAVGKSSSAMMDCQGLLTLRLSRKDRLKLMDNWRKATAPHYIAGMTEPDPPPTCPIAPERGSLSHLMRAQPGHPDVEWRVEELLTGFEDAVAQMEARAGAIADGSAGELVWLVEHPPLYTAGTSAKDSDLMSGRFPVHRTGRGGQFTYHGPGQRVAYVMLDLKKRRPDVRAYVCALEDWIIATLAAFNIRGERRADRVGVWVQRPDKPRGLKGEMAEDKIAAIGIRIRRWVTFHGISLNVEPALDHFSGIVPCGIADAHLGVTSLVDLGLPVTMDDVDDVMRRTFREIF
jgi:lipoyl(octanoyl) transferase